MPNKAGRIAAKALGIKLQEEDPYTRELERPGASMISNVTSHTFVEEPPHVVDWFLGLIPTGEQIYRYLLSLFPFLSWIGHYNLQWLIGDLVAGEFVDVCAFTAGSLLTPLGITIGAVVVPQGMAYAKLANLPVQFGLYSSFMGVLIYWFFATSKDITIGVSIILIIRSFKDVTDFPSPSPSCPNLPVALWLTSPR